MDIPDRIIKKLFSWLDHQKEFANIVENLATELEEHRKNVNISKVVGSSASVLGGVATIGAGILTIATGGLATPLLIGGIAATGLGVATSVGSELVEVFISSSTMKKAEEISQQSTAFAKEIQRLTELLEKEWEKKEQNYQRSTGMNKEDYTMAKLLQAMAGHWGLPWHDNFKFLLPNSSISKPMFTEGKVGRVPRLTLSAHLLSNLILQTPVTKSIAAAAITAGAMAAGETVITIVAQVGAKAAAKRIGSAFVGGGVIGLAISFPELIINCKELVKNNKGTEASQSLRETAESMKTACKAVQTEVDEIRKAFERLAKVKNCIENSGNRSEEERRRELIEYAIENCPDETTRQWLMDNLKSAAFLNLVEMFDFVKQSIDKEEEKEEETDPSREIDIIFVAHGCISNPTIPAICYMPLPTITDVVLYTPWNCAINADAAYGVATGYIHPDHRVFECSGNGCRTPSPGHQPINLPNKWNSMKEAGTQTIPNIMLSPVGGPNDGAWERVYYLFETFGAPGKNRIVIPYIVPWSGKDSGVPFVVITLALALVLLFSRFRATVHLAACLGRCSETQMNEAQLQHQYAYTMDNTFMKPSESMLLYSPNSGLYKALKALFG